MNAWNVYMCVSIDIKVMHMDTIKSMSKQLCINCFDYKECAYMCSSCMHMLFYIIYI